MKNYIFVEEKTKKIVDQKDYYIAGDKALGYAEALSKKSKTKVYAYCKVCEH